MSSLNDVFAAIEDFRSELFSAQHSAEALLTPARARAGLRGVLGNLVSPLENIHATGVGIRRKENSLLSGEFVIKVYVFHKLGLEPSLIPHILAAPFQGVDIDVEELSVMQIHAKRQAAATSPAQHRRRRRPVVGGLEIQPRGAEFVGTLGGFVRPAAGNANTIFALSNNHVLADTNRLPTGTEITQPFSDRSEDVFARLTNFEPIKLPSREQPFPARNRMDAAIARVTDSALVKTGAMFGIPNYVPTLKAASPGMTVTKSGRTTGVTTGRISAIRVNGVRVNYGTLENPLIGTFDGCVQVVGDDGRAFSSPGDSGSFILDRSTGRPMALLFAGNLASTTGCDLTAVCSRFNVLPV